MTQVPTKKKEKKKLVAKILAQQQQQQKSINIIAGNFDFAIYLYFCCGLLVFWNKQDYQTHPVSQD